MCPRILVVDDEPSIVETLAELLAWDGHEALSADNGVKALAVLEHDEPDLVLLDYMMPFKNGLDTLREIRTKYPSLPVIMMTAAPTSLAGKSAPYDALLVKPFTAAALRSAMETVLSHPRR